MESRSRVLFTDNPPRWIATALYLFLLLWGATGASLALDPARNIDQYGHEQWTSQNGLPGEAVYQILQTRDGYLWLRTSAGLVRFDGVRFVLMEPAPSGQPVHEPVKAICKGTSGDLLVRTTSRTLIYKGGAFFDYLPPASLPDGDIRVLYESERRELFIGSDDFIYRIGSSGRPELLRGGTSLVYAFVDDGRGTLWISSLSGLYPYRNGILEPQPVSASKSVTVVGGDREKHIWAGTVHGLRLFQNGRFIPNPRAGVISGEIGAIAGDRDGNLWVGTNDAGLVRFTGNRVSRFGSEDGLTDHWVLSLFEDREGSLWVGTSAGLDRFRDTSLTTYTVKEKLPSDRASNLIQTRDGSLYIFCQGGGLARVKDGVVTRIMGKDGLPNIYSNGMFESKDGSLWLGVNGGLTRYKDGKFTQYGAGGRLSKYFISAIGEDDEGLIVSTSETLALRFRDGRAWPFTVRGKPTPLSTPGNYTFTIYRDPDGNTWFGTVGGLFRFSPGGPPENAGQAAVHFPVTTIFDDRKGSLWLGGRVPGLTRFRIRDGRVTRYTESSGLFDDYPSCILTDSDGNFWISTSSGIYVASAKALDDFADGRAGTVASARFGTADGMKTSEASQPLAQPAGLRARDGRLWFGSAKGVVVVDPRHLLHNRLIPPVVIEEIVADGKMLSERQNLRLAPGTSRIEIHFASLSLVLPGHDRFKFKLEGYDRDWVDAGSRRVASYTKLPPARYRFRVIASNNDGVWNEEGAAVNFVLLPQFYQTAWFYTLSGMAVLVLSCGFYLLRVRYLILRNQELERNVALRTDELLKTARDLETEKAELLRAREELRRIATSDGLTGVWNRLAIFDLLTSTLARCARTERSVSVIMCDLDDFKSINDRYGHPAGDLALREAARRFQSCLRSSDFVGRYGGEEFLMVLPDCGCAEARVRAEHLRLALEAHPIELPQASVVLTSSFGVSCSREGGGAYDTDLLVRQADDALYRAKKSGKNRAESPATPEVASLAP